MIFSLYIPSVSVNGDEVTMNTLDKQVSIKRYSALTPQEKTNLESIKDQMMSVVRLGPFNVKSQTGVCKLTTFDRYGGSSSMGASGASGSSSSTSTSSSSSSTSNGISISTTGPNAFIVSKPDFAFNWQRLFVNDDIVTIVYRDGRVVMLCQDLLRPDEKAKVMEVRQEVSRSAQASENLTKSIKNSFKNPMDFVNKALSGIFG